MKHVKKSMFISTVLMVVMLIAALSTATFAWYTSNSSAGSTATQVGAAESSAANIGIGFYKGATSSTIDFQPLVDSLAKGDMNPTVPVKFYEDISGQAVAARYTTTNGNVESGMFIANGVVDAAGSHDYLRIVDLTSAQTADIVAASAYIHSYTDGIYTNLPSTIGAKYEKIWRLIKYAYNDSQLETVAAATPITVGANGQYAIASADGTVYGVQKAFLVSNTTGVDYADFDYGTSTAINMSCAYTLSGNKWTPAEGGYVVAYYQYGTIGYKAAVTTIDANAEFVGYAATTADTLNAGDILAENVLNSATYPTITDIKYDSENFAKLYKIFDATNGERVVPDPDNSIAGNILTNESNFANFKFNKASMDADGYFAANGSAASIGAKYSGSGAYNGGGYDVAVVTGLDSRNMATSTFYVTNNGTTTINNLQINLATSGDNADLLRIALFMNGNYIGTMAGANNAPTAFGQILKGAAAKDMATYEAKNQFDLGALAAGNTNAAAFQIVAWFDGKLLNDAAAGKTCAFTLTFNA